jgi:hypothetical protein
MNRMHTLWKIPGYLTNRWENIETFLSCIFNTLGTLLNSERVKNIWLNIYFLRRSLLQSIYIVWVWKPERSTSDAVQQIQCCKWQRNYFRNQPFCWSFERTNWRLQEDAVERSNQEIRQIFTKELDGWGKYSIHFSFHIKYWNKLF